MKYTVSNKVPVMRKCSSSIIYMKSTELYLVHTALPPVEGENPQESSLPDENISISESEIERRASDPKILTTIQYLKRKFCSFSDESEIESICWEVVYHASVKYNKNNKAKAQFSTYLYHSMCNGILSYLQKEKKHMKVDSLDKEMFANCNNSHVTVVDTFKSDYNIEDEYIKKETDESAFQKLYDLLDYMKENMPNEYQLITERYPLDFNVKRKTQTKLAEKYKVTQPYIAKREKAILQFMRNQLLLSSRFAIDQDTLNDMFGYGN